MALELFDKDVELPTGSAKQGEIVRVLRHKTSTKAKTYSSGTEVPFRILSAICVAKIECRASAKGSTGCRREQSQGPGALRVQRRT